MQRQQQIQRLGVAHLADDEPIRRHPQRLLHESAQAHRTGPLDEEQVTVAFGSDPVQLPPRLAELLRRVIETPSRSPVADDRWVFRGLRPGAHLANGSVSAALRPAGISVQQGRLVALMNLSRDLQPAVVADLIGVTAVTAARWSTHAGGDWAAYPMLRDSP